jgi:hypothetical protein
MSKELMLTALRQGKNGAQILEILNALVSDGEGSESGNYAADGPTLLPVEF